MPIFLVLGTSAAILYFVSGQPMIGLAQYMIDQLNSTTLMALPGSSVATALAMGTILAPVMIERGYPRSFVLGVLGGPGTIGVVITPSLALILYGIVTEQSVPRLFLAGIPPGLLQAGTFFLWALSPTTWRSGWSTRRWASTSMSFPPSPTRRSAR
jgi:C4-dicarboxylate transporter DctM subunit